MSTDYKIDFTGALVTHELQRYLVLRDQADDSYFKVLAGWLQDICAQLGEEYPYEVAKLERVADDLLFLQKEYKITKKVTKTD